ncbi:MAG: GTPase [Candidatus Thermoplasmatota archaeon]|nr:GTPase [Candidatus Thermoplasmatota archaeon]
MMPIVNPRYIRKTQGYSSQRPCSSRPPHETVKAGIAMVSVEWRRIPTVLLPQEIIDKAFRKASKMAALVEDPDKYHRVRKQMNRMVQSSSDTIATTLLDWVDRWPSLNALSSFDQALIDASVGADDYRKNLGGIQWGAEQIRRIAGRIQSEMLRIREIAGFHESRRSAYGRFASVLDQLEPQLEWLNKARDRLRELPSIDPANPCIVVAGAPNVGKSALITALSSGEPEVAAYPFTTKRLHLGHFNHRRRKYQMVDTPGLLDRPNVERNAIEMQAIAALENVGDVVLFLIDPSESGGTPLSEQMSLLEEVKGLISARRFILVRSKADIEAQSLPGSMPVSSIDGTGLEELRSAIVTSIAADVVDDPLNLPSDWHREDTGIGL